MTSLLHKAGWLLSGRSLALTILAVLSLSGALIGGWYFWPRQQPTTCSGTYDLVLIGGEIIDGLGGATLREDIGIREKRIACIGSIPAANAQKVINVHGLAIAPGFIDVHTHVERNVPPNAPFIAPSFLLQGVTTIITGNCGRSFLDIGQFFKLLETN